jgi:hypothetical protein
VLVVVAAVSFFLVSTRPQELPEPLYSDYRSEFVSATGGYRFWPISAPVDESVAYRFDAGHCGLNHLADFDASFWDPVNPNVGEEPMFFYSEDAGTIRLVGPDEATYTSSSGQAVMLVRVDGPVVTMPCA